MSQGLVERQYLQDIGDAIRSKNGSTDTYTPAEMAQAISGIHTADEVVLVQKTVNANGQYNASDDSADGYSGVRVNVPNSYSASDEGKVVSSGNLVAQTTKQITANGTHDTTTNNSVVINVPNSYAAADEGKVVSGGALVGQTSRNVTVNGTYDTTTNNEVVVNVSGGGGGTGGDPIPFIVTVSSTYNSAYSAQNAFNDSGFWGANGGTTEWLKLQFNDPVKITAIKFGNTFIIGNLHWTSSRITFQASNDDTTWVDLYDATNLSDSPDNYYEYLLQNNNEYIYYRFLCYKGSYYACIGKIKLSFENASLDDNIIRNGNFTINTTGVTQWDASNSGTSAGSRYPIIDDWEIMQCVAEKTSQGIIITPSQRYAYLTQQINKWYAGKNIKLSAIVNGNEYNITGVLSRSGTSCALNTPFGQLYAYAYGYADIVFTLMFYNQIGNEFIITNTKVELA